MKYPLFLFDGHTSFATDENNNTVYYAINRR